MIQMCRVVCLNKDCQSGDRKSAELAKYGKMAATITRISPPNGAQFCYLELNIAI